MNASHAVVLVGGDGMELELAHVTGKLLLAVSLHMRLEAVGILVCVAAEVADVGAGSLVQDHMLLEVSLHREGLTADWTTIVFGGFVPLLVDARGYHRGEALEGSSGG